MNIQTYSTVKPNLAVLVVHSSGLQIPAADASIGGTSFSNWAAWMSKPTEIGGLHGSATSLLEDRPSHGTSSLLHTKLVASDETPESTMHPSPREVYVMLRNRMEQDGIDFLSEDQLAAEIAERKGGRA